MRRRLSCKEPPKKVDAPLPFPYQVWVCNVFLRFWKGYP